MTGTRDVVNDTTQSSRLHRVKRPVGARTEQKLEIIKHHQCIGEPYNKEETSFLYFFPRSTRRAKCKQNKRRAGDVPREVEGGEGGTQFWRCPAKKIPYRGEESRSTKLEIKSRREPKLKGIFINAASPPATDEALATFWCPLARHQGFIPFAIKVYILCFYIFVVLRYSIGRVPIFALSILEWNMNRVALCIFRVTFAVIASGTAEVDPCTSQKSRSSTAALNSAINGTNEREGRNSELTNKRANSFFPPRSSR